MKRYFMVLIFLCLVMIVFSDQITPDKYYHFSGSFLITEFGAVISPELLRSELAMRKNLMTHSFLRRI
jgi:hypothetical protein